MEYQVPQFIEVEDRIFGPLTIKQFVYLAGGAGIVAILMLLLPFFFGILLSIPVAGFALALAFYQVNGKPFIEILESGFTYLVGGREYLWRKVKEPVSPEAVAKSEVPTPVPPLVQKEGLSRRKLEELAWSLDVKAGSSNTEA